MHGAVWDYIQNQYFNAADYLSTANPKDNINQVGFTIGGPVIKDKLFLFGAFQDLIGRLQTTGSIPVIGYAERGLNPDGVTARPCNTAGPFPGMTCASFLADATGGKILNPESITGSSGNQATPADAENNFNSAYQQAGGTGVSPCIGLLQQAATYAANNNFVGTTTKQPTYLPFGEAPLACLNPVMLKVVNTLCSRSSQFDRRPCRNTIQQPYRRQKPAGALRLCAERPTQLRCPIQPHQFQRLRPAGRQQFLGRRRNLRHPLPKALSNFGNVGWSWVMTPNLLNRTALRI